MVINISYLLSTPIAAYVFLPVFYRLQSASVYKSVIIPLLTALDFASVKPRRILPGEKLGENTHFLDHTCSFSPRRKAGRKARRKQI